MSNPAMLLAEIAKRCPLGQLPNDYLVLDLETSGFKRKSDTPDVIVQVGYAVVCHREITHNTAHYLRRPMGTMYGEAMRVNGITDEMLQKLGEPPVETYQRLLPLLKLYHESKAMFIGHNLLSFDIPFLSFEFKKYNVDFTFSPDEVIDTGCIIKAMKMDLLPGPSEGLGKFLRRIRNARNSHKWSLTHAVDIFELERLYGLDMTRAHDAGFDCRLTHLVLESLRSPHVAAALERFYIAKAKEDEQRKASRLSV